MRLGQAIVFGSAAALLTLAAPTLARNSSAHSHAKATDTPAASSCQAYQQTADASWMQLPCQEMGSRAQAEPRSATKSAIEETR